MIHTYYAIFTGILIENKEGSKKAYVGPMCTVTVFYSLVTVLYDVR